MSNRLRVGILGSGFGGSVHAPAFAAHDGFELVAIASPNNARRIAEERGISHAFASLEEMIETVQLDLLSIAAPPFAHHAAVMAAIDRGMHILCEKPFAKTLHEATQMADAAETAGIVGTIAHEFRFLPARQAARELIVNQHLGALRQIEITQCSGFLSAKELKPRSWWFDRALGGGITGALLSHMIDLATWLAGRPPLRATGLARTANALRHDAEGEFAVTADDGGFAVLDYGDGLIARLCVDGTSAVKSFVFAVHGEKRTTVASGSSIFEETMYTVDEEETSELELLPLKHAALAAASPILPAFMAMLDALVEKIAGRPSEIATFGDGLETQRVLEILGFGQALPQR